MSTTVSLDDAEYDPNRLLDFLIDKMRTKNDAGLSRQLGVAPPVISKIRQRIINLAHQKILAIIQARYGLGLRSHAPKLIRFSLPRQHLCFA